MEDGADISCELLALDVVFFIITEYRCKDNYFSTRFFLPIDPDFRLLCTVLRMNKL